MVYEVSHSVTKSNFSICILPLITGERGKAWFRSKRDHWTVFKFSNIIMIIERGLPRLFGHFFSFAFFFLLRYFIVSILYSRWILCCRSERSRSYNIMENNHLYTVLLPTYPDSFCDFYSVLVTMKERICLFASTSSTRPSHKSILL